MIYATIHQRHKAHTEEVVTQNIQRVQIKFEGWVRMNTRRSGGFFIADMPVSHQKSTRRRSALMQERTKALRKILGEFAHRAPCTMKCLSLSRCTSMTYRALYLISPSAFDFIANTNRAVRALAPSGSSSFSMTHIVPRRSKSLTSFIFASWISGDIARQNPCQLPQWHVSMFSWHLRL